MVILLSPNQSKKSLSQFNCCYDRSSSFVSNGLAIILEVVFRYLFICFIIHCQIGAINISSWTSKMILLLIFKLLFTFCRPNSPLDMPSRNLRPRQVSYLQILLLFFLLSLVCFNCVSIKFSSILCYLDSLVALIFVVFLL